MGGELLNQSIGPILILGARGISLLGRDHSAMGELLLGRMVLLERWLLRLLLLRLLLLRVRIVHEIALVVAWVHIFLPALVRIHRWLREGRRSGRIGPIVALRGKLAVVEAEVQVQAIAVRIHLDRSSSSQAYKRYTGIGCIHTDSGLSGTTRSVAIGHRGIRQFRPLGHQGRGVETRERNDRLRHTTAYKPSTAREPDRHKVGSCEKGEGADNENG